MSDLINRFLSLILMVTSMAMTVALIFVGYEVALVVMESGFTSGQISTVVLAAFPSLFALLSLPFWLTLRRLNG